MYTQTPLFASAIVVALISINACVAAERGNERETATELSREHLRHDGLRRSYYLHLPPGHAAAETMPVLLVLHGGGGRKDGDDIAAATGFNELADREGFIAVYPNGVDGQWNDGRGATYSSDADELTADDVGFLSRVIDRFVAEHKGDATRVYATGLSNGGMMTLRLGAERSGKLAAIAPVIANIPENLVDDMEPERKLPVLLMNGTEDPLMPWDGGVVRFFRREMGEVVSTEATIDFWVRHNGCQRKPEVTRLPDRDRRDESRVVVKRHAAGRTGAPVVLYAIVGGGHTFPGSDIPDRPFLVGHKNMDIDARVEIWNFLEGQQRQQPSRKR